MFFEINMSKQRSWLAIQKVALLTKWPLRSKVKRSHVAHVCIQFRAGKQSCMYWPFPTGLADCSHYSPAPYCFMTSSIKACPMCFLPSSLAPPSFPPLSLLCLPARSISLCSATYANKVRSLIAVQFIYPKQVTVERFHLHDNHRARSPGAK